MTAPMEKRGDIAPGRTRAEAGREREAAGRPEVLADDVTARAAKTAAAVARGQRPAGRPRD